ncbi:dynamin family protein [Virgibacillus sp. W0181]|uniref:dynamin family protein n=1 Tax=Virgibacillus sp. W0181 TaxID=3391581 RepID=UPI003F4565F8
MTVLEKKKTNLTLEHIVSFHKLLKENNDQENANKMLELFEKVNNKEVMISFAGHFSAGKSSMINKLLDQEILPKSPIPTSANIVKIASGNESAKIFFHHDPPIKYNAPYDIELIKDYCKDKDTIKQIELITDNPFLPKNTALVDTPGIDAADDADRLMTESSLHLVDIMFYVMDYNHVQSEVNLLFLKSLQEKSIPYYVIINQVDKHNEKELSFSAFESSIKQTFDQWDIYPNSILYSSLIDADAKHNQFNEIKQLLFELLRLDKNTVMRTEQSIHQVIDDHKLYLKQEAEEKLASFANDNVDESDISKLDSVEQKLTELNALPQQMKESFMEQLNITLKNAYLMPADLRDKAEAFLLSQQKGFKLGLFSTKKKTEEEKQNRLNTFLNAVQKSIEASIQWKLRDKVLDLLNENKLSDPQLMENVQQLAIHYEGEDLLKHIKDGAQVNGKYILNYTNDISADIKSKFRAKALELWREIEASIINYTKQEMTSYEDERDQLKIANEWKQNKLKIENELENLIKKLNETFEYPEADSSVEKQIQQQIEAKNKITTVTENEKVQMEEEKKKETPSPTKEKIKQTATTNSSVNDVIHSIDRTIAAIGDLPVFQDIIHNLKNKQDRLRNRTITIALFGAFSAGKSSFANALFGERLLPVSPNPTTAVINRISPVTTDYEHGTVVIKLKDKDTLFQDLYQITKEFLPPKDDFDSLLTWVKENKIYKKNELNKMYRSYIEAMINGYDQLKDVIGNTMTITIEQFSEYVTDETKACYFELIDLYYKCPLTEQGITLVDTPGADSVNARHTNVAFDYIKYADAILYVTYYNHALSRADKDFLMQLGRVKEAFELDKMFFIINASDLAENDSDLKLVIQYVEDQLLQLGVRFPRIFPVSSKRSLENKLNNESLNQEMQLFESDFYHFINEDLAALMIEAALWDINRAAQLMNNYMNSVQMDHEQQENYINDLNEKQTSLHHAVKHFNPSLFKERIIERIERQLHYVEERIAIRFHDMFTEHFNPTTVTESGRKATQQLERNLVRLIDYTGYELLQELRAVSLRLEARIKELTIEMQNQIQAKCKEVEPSYLLPSPNMDEFDTPAYDQAFANININKFDKIVKAFKGTKSFFEKNEKEVMKDNIYESLSPEIKQYIQTNKELMEQEYIHQWNDITDSLKEAITNNITSYIKNNISMITDQMDIQELKEKQQQLHSILERIEK